MTTSEWINSLNDFEGEIDKEEAKFIFEQSEKLLKDIVDTNILIINRTTTLTTLVVAVMLTLIGFSFNRWIAYNYIDDYIITAIVITFYYFCLCIMLTKNIQPKQYGVCGAQPKDLFVGSFYTEVTKEKRVMNFYCNEIINYQKKIDMNKITNEKRWRLFNNSLWGIVLSPLVIPFVFMAVKFLSLTFGCTCR